MEYIAVILEGQHIEFYKKEELSKKSIEDLLIGKGTFISSVETAKMYKKEHPEIGILFENKEMEDYFNN